MADSALRKSATGPRSGGTIKSTAGGESVMNINTIIYIVGLVVVIGFVLNLLGVY